MYKDLSKYVELLERSGELRRISTKVSSELEISEIVDRVSKEPDGGYALLFEDSGTEFPVLCNMMGSERRMALSLGLSSLDELPSRVEELLSLIKTPRTTLFEKLAILPILGSASRWFPKRSRRRGKCQEVIYQGDNVDLGILPILKTWPHDGGRFITLPLVSTVDLENGAKNLGMYRMQVIDGKTTGMHWQLHKTGARHYEQYKRAGKRMPVTVCLGGDPAYTYAATAPLPDGIDEYILAGFLRKKPVKLVKCITNSMEVPSDCDIVIEGYIDPTEDKFIEGPFGDHTGFYSLEDLYPKMHITAITHRRGAIYPATLVGVPPMEDRYIALASERLFTPPIKALIAPEITDMWMPWQGVAHNMAVVTINKSFEGQGIKVASALWGAGQMSVCKLIWIATENPSEQQIRRWMLGIDKFNAEIFFSEGITDILDHAPDTMGRSGKICIDTTSQNASTYQIVPHFDSGIEELTEDERLWILLGNIDPTRDIELSGATITINAQSKVLKNRDFPNIVTMDIDTIEMVDNRWTEYNLGDRIESPSHRYHKFIKGNGAKQ